MVTAIQEKFKDIFNAEADAIFSAAGRVNLIGEHINYCGGKVLPGLIKRRAEETDYSQRW